MTAEDYWREAALMREQEAHTAAEDALKQMLQLYDDALKDINGELDKIKYNYAKRFGIDEETAERYLARARRGDGMNELAQMLLDAQTDDERRAILDFVHRDGLSTRAYGARTARFDELKNNIKLRMIRLEMAVREAGENIRREAYTDNYIRVIDDIARGLNMGILFSLIDNAALNEVMEKPWHGKRFSERVWDNTERLAKEAQEIAGRYIVSGRSLDKAAAELAEAFEVEKFHATTLIHTEVAHARSMSDMKAYEEIDAEYYRYLASLDELTCPICGSLDGQRFRVSEAVEGDNYPVMHPRCRCTTTADMDWLKRSARDPITGKNDRIDGSVTYEQWRANMTDKEKAAFDKTQRKYRNKAADKRQHEKYREILGKDVPRSLDKFQELKYNGGSEWAEMKSLYQGLNNGTVIKNAVGQYIEIVSRTSLTYKPNAITQVTNKRGGIDRNYYDSNGKQYKQISNNGHGHKKEEMIGKHGEHAHDYNLNEKGLPKHGEARELKADERKENADIL